MNTATEKQIDYINRLTTEREVDESVLDMGRTLWEAGALTREAASTLIDALLEAPKKQTEEPVEPPEGMHKVGDLIFKVQRSPESGRLYAKRLVLDEDGTRFEYAPGATKALTTMTLMTLEQAKEFGALYGTCCVCGRTLTNEASIAAGIGPVCAGKF